MPLDGLLGQCLCPTLHRLVAFLETLGHVWVRDAYGSWDQPCDEACACSTRRADDLCPTLDSVADDRRGVLRVIERPYRHEPGQGPFHVEAVRLGVSKDGKEGTVDGALANLFQATGFES
jgi:hypothetical protein